MSKKVLSDQINALLGLSDSNCIDFSPMKTKDLEKLLAILQGNQGPRTPLKTSVETRRKPLLERRPFRDFLQRVVGP